MSRILVTGAGGMLGSTLVPHLRAFGHDVTSCSRSGQTLRADLTDPVQARRALHDAKPEVIVNLAALTNVDECERDPQAAYRLNVRLVENLVNAIMAEGHGCYLIHMSTDQVYDGAGPHTEEDVLLVNYYAFSKYAGELAARMVPSTILRTNFFGLSQCAGRNSFSDWLASALASGMPVTAFEDVRFSPLNLETVARMIALVVDRRRTGVYNLGSHDALSKAEFAFQLATLLGLPTHTMRRGRSSEAGLGARRPTDMSMDCSRFERAFGVTLPTLASEISLLKEAQR